jgi:2-polyprenyl-6-methoxyphenol hydroxylase-like FAD-dependent oxidoreductase
MKIIIAGAGAVGTHLAKLLAREKQDIILMDENEQKLENLDSNFDLMTMHASPTSIQALKEEGVANEERKDHHELCSDHAIRFLHILHASHSDLFNGNDLYACQLSQCDYHITKQHQQCGTSYRHTDRSDGIVECTTGCGKMDQFNTDAHWTLGDLQCDCIVYKRFLERSLSNESKTKYFHI